MKAFQIYNTTNELPNGWANLVDHDIFLQPNYLKALEDASPSNIQVFYVGVFKGNKLVGIAIVQRVQLYLKDMFRKTKVSCLKEFFRNLISKVLKGNVLVVGNLTHTGQHAIYFDETKITQHEYLDGVLGALEELRLKIRTLHGKKIRAIMMKDFFTDDAIHSQNHFLNQHRLHRVIVQPNMVLNVSNSWLSFDDYITDLNKKYRDRYKRSRRKLVNIMEVEMDLEAIRSSSNKLYQLYLNVSNNAKFNTFILPENHFYSLKLRLKDNFKVFGYLLEGELIGFYSLILNRKQLETYFLGYDIEHQYPNQLYLNMLYDMLKFGIENRFSSIVYARTAMAIKSSVGAKPKPMLVYLKHTNNFMNAILKLIFKFMNPTQDWKERHPFS